MEMIETTVLPRLVTAAAALTLLALVMTRATTTALPPEESLMLRRGEPIRIALPAGRRGERFSRWRCVGGLEDVENFEHRACVFEDVCYDAESSDFLYYAPTANGTVAPVLYDHRRGAQRRFRQRRSAGDPVDADFVALSKWVPYRQRLSWSPRVVGGPVPSQHRALDGVTALSAPFVPTNLGHVAWDESFPLLVAMAQLGVYSPTLRILRTHGCEVLPKEGSRRVCEKFAAAFLAPLTGDRSAALLTLAQLRVQSRPTGLVCFRKLLVGSAFDAFNSDSLNDGKEPLLTLYRARVLAWHGVHPTAVPKRHSILLVRKNGKRAIANFDDVHEYVTTRYHSVATISSTSFNELPMAQQLALVAQTSIAVSPCGGISMILPFLPEGAYAILMNYMAGDGEVRRHGECEGCSWTMEAELWRHVPHVNKMYYQVWGPADFARGKPGHDAAVQVDPARLGGLIDAALQEMQP